MKTKCLGVVLFALVFGLVARAQPAPHYEQHQGVSLPFDTLLTDEDGRPRRLGEFFHDRPVVLVFGYFRCAQLCSIVADATVETLHQIKPTEANAFEFLYVSIDPTDTPSAATSAKARDLRHYAHPGADTRWHYLTGPETQLQPLARAAGFNYRYDVRSTQYVHPSGIVIVTPGGMISRYFLGIDYAPSDVAAALHRAADGKTGESVYDLVLTCFRGGTLTGRYGPTIWLVLQLSVGGTVLALGTGIALLLRAERRRGAGRPTSPGSNVSELP